ncbi:uncharacterized protein NECHADRAFT_77319 [Fusarium vanettenii 77-13-4]|uniref:Heterokaryon incompatibility domain-containing protein n=1 Tax=Fusarium vanettenii (strain ATCC MYA-4622 / CBS 123669 / FGSC 9596 / NRRL 45880 / 77-13-4) TaxID=660122 RepID=C7YKW6_FUSV7|nr:uncharacterized protein NECHADRAFT_77319 [Fusarium vanettenii 77-13-4]EEU46690.1 hypothetical protein NECHADRAFT_77319 [Fusarium vanettenii 77-13-4]
MPQTRAQTRKRHSSNETPPPAPPKRARKLLNDVPNPLPYRQLDLKSHQIRILHLHPGKRKDPIRCVLQTALLDDGPKYEALSNAWGDPLDCRSIEVDGRRKSITVNLYHALLRLRYPRRERCLWVDALCINQDNDIEKSHQVKLMSKIYSRTRRAILWLGDFSYGPIAKVNQIPRKTATATFALIKAMAANNHYSSGHEGGNRELADQGIAGLSCLFQLPWWNRAWTLQEAVLPSNATVVCGTVQLPLSSFMEAYMHSISHLEQGCCENTDDWDPFWNQLHGLVSTKENIQGGRHRINDALNIFRARHASDPRDRIYAYLGLGSDISANYSIPHEEVFKLAARALVEETGTLYSLLRTYEENRSPSLPTWAPDWCADFKERDYDNELAWLFLHHCYRAAGEVKAITRLSSSDAVLDLQGLVLDRIVAAGHVLNTDCRMKEIITEWQHTPNSEYPQGGTYKEASWRTILCDMEKMVNYELRQVKNISAYSKRGFSTAKGLIGLGNRDIQVGDFICVLGGGSMPFILRQVEGHGGDIAYQYIGQAYVHGIMDGEVMNEGQDLEWISLV